MLGPRFTGKNWYQIVVVVEEFPLQQLARAADAVLRWFVPTVVAAADCGVCGDPNPCPSTPGSCSQVKVCCRDTFTNQCYLHARCNINRICVMRHFGQTC
ncbi:hypothetical protein WEH80_09150 [Actinomycetes bacterium KLBMP 9759]